MLLGKVKAEKYECRGVKSDGNILYLNIYGTYIVYKERPAIVGTIIDNTIQEIAHQRIEKLNKRLKKFNRRLKQLALRDLHTGLYNHCCLGEYIETELYRAKRYDQPPAFCNYARYRLF